ncbi:MAG: YbhN family protein [Mariniblastus sp.]
MSSPTTPNQPPSPKTYLFKWFRVTVAGLVVGAVLYTAIIAFRQLQDSDFDFSKIQYQWWILAIMIYIATMSLSCLFWHRVLLALGQKPKLANSMLAFFASQLGKYVPSKAMVVIIRTDMIRGDEVRTAPAAASVFVETLTWLFVGSAIANVLLIFQFRDQVTMQIGAGVLTLVAGVLTWPPIFRRIAIKLGSARGRNIEQMFDGLNFQTMGFGWFVMTIGWCLNGMSLWFVLKGIPGTEMTMADFPLALACVSLATVAGFVSLLPGGIGVRELVMIPLLGARFGSVTAIIAAIVIRVVWLAAELLTSGIIYLYRRRTNL